MRDGLLNRAPEKDFAKQKIFWEEETAERKTTPRYAARARSAGDERSAILKEIIAKKQQKKEHSHGCSFFVRDGLLNRAPEKDFAKQKIFWEEETAERKTTPRYAARVRSAGDECTSVLKEIIATNYFKTKKERLIGRSFSLSFLRRRRVLSLRRA